MGPNKRQDGDVMSDLVKRLREGVVHNEESRAFRYDDDIDEQATNERMSKAADEIDRLEAAIEELWGEASEYVWPEKLSDDTLLLLGEERTETEGE